jgi:hypothetical protein
MENDDPLAMPVEYRLVGIQADSTRKTLGELLSHWTASRIRIELLQRGSFWKLIVEPMKPISPSGRQPPDAP